MWLLNNSDLNTFLDFNVLSTALGNPEQVVLQADGPSSQRPLKHIPVIHNFCSSHSKLNFSHYCCMCVHAFLWTGKSSHFAWVKLATTAASHHKESLTLVELLQNSARTPFHCQAFFKTCMFVAHRTCFSPYPKGHAIGPPPPHKGKGHSIPVSGLPSVSTFPVQPLSPTVSLFLSLWRKEIQHPQSFDSESYVFTTYSLMGLNIHSHLFWLIRDRGKLGGGYLCPTTYLLHCHNQNDSALRQAAVWDLFHVSVIVRAKSQDSVHKSQILKKKESWSGPNQGLSAYQP